MISQHLRAVTPLELRQWTEFLIELMFDLILLAGVAALLLVLCRGLITVSICFVRALVFIQRAIIFTARFFVEYVRLRLSVSPVVLKTDISVDGVVKWDTNGPYIMAYHLGKSLRVNVKSESLVSLLLKPAIPVVDETRIADSQVDPMAFHSGTVQFLVNGKLLGFGFRTTVKGRSVIVTTCHGLQSLLGKEVMLAGPSGQIKMPPNSIYAKFPGLDVVCLEFSNVVYTTLGVKSLKIAAPGVGSPIHVHGYMDGQRVRSIGVIAGLVRKSAARFKHTASTVEGFSGSPVLNTTGQVVGMHLRGNITYNEAVALNWLVGFNESDIPDKLMTRLDDLGDEAFATLGFIGKDMMRVRFKGRGFTMPEEVSVWQYDPRYSSWADDEDDAWWDMAMLEGKEEAADVESAEPLNSSPVVLPDPQTTEATSVIGSLDIPALNLSEKSSRESSPSCVREDIRDWVLQGKKQSKGARRRANRQLEKLADGHGLQQTSKPVTPPLMPIAEELKSASNQPRIRFPEQFLPLCGAACIHAPMSQRDYERVKHLASAYEAGVVPKSKSSRLRSEWASLWTK